MSRRPFSELQVISERAGLSVKFTRKLPGNDVPIASGLEGFYMTEIDITQNPKPGAEEIQLGRTLEDAKKALAKMIKETA